MIIAAVPDELVKPILQGFAPFYSEHSVWGISISGNAAGQVQRLSVASAVQLTIATAPPNLHVWCINKRGHLPTAIIPWWPVRTHHVARYRQRDRGNNP